MLYWLCLLVALAQDPPGPGFRVDDENGWSREGMHLNGPGGAVVALGFDEPVAAGAPPEQGELAVKDIGRERAALIAEMSARKLVAREVEGRIVTTPVGEPQVLLVYRLTRGKGYEGEAPSGGIRVVRRCGTTVRLTLEGEQASQSTLLEAAAQLLWAAPECEHYNTHPYRRVEAPQPTAPPDPATVAPPPPPGKARVLMGVAVVMALLSGAGAFVWWTLRGRQGRSEPSLPRGLSGRSSARPEPAPISPPLVAPASPAPPAPAPASPARPEPRPLGALGAQEGVWVSPVAGTRHDDPLAIAIKRLSNVMGLDKSPPKAAEIPDLPHTYRALLELHDGLVFGGGWLRLLGCWEGRGLTVQELNRAIQGRVGRRFVIGFFGNGTLVMLSPRGEAQIAAPGDRVPFTVASNLTVFLENLADDMELRQRACSHTDVLRASRVLGPCGPDQVVVEVDDDLRKESVIAVWERAQSLL